jgi:chromosome segregation ATPase
MAVGGAGISGGGASPQIDTNALIELLTSKGGAQAQIAEYQRAKQAYEKAYADLNLGRSARDALDSIEATKEAAKKKIEADRAAFQREVEAAKEAYQKWADGVKADIQDKLAEAKTKVAQSDKLVADGQALYKGAELAKQEAESEMAKAQAEMRKAKSLASKAEAAIEDCDSLKSRYNAVIKSIKDAAASI